MPPLTARAGRARKALCSNSSHDWLGLSVPCEGRAPLWVIVGRRDLR